MKSSELEAIASAALDFCTPDWRSLPPLMRQALKDGMILHLHEAYMRAANKEYYKSK